MPANLGWWTEERRERAIQMRKDGRSMGVIADTLGTTRSAIAGKFKREGVSISGFPLVVRVPRPREATVLRPIRRADGNLPARPIPLPLPTDAARRSFSEHHGPNYSLISLGCDDCRFPIGEPGDENFCFCAAPRVFGPYCENHARLSYYMLR